VHSKGTRLVLVNNSLKWLTYLSLLEYNFTKGVEDKNKTSRVLP